jgi:hypothetical protein
MAIRFSASRTAAIARSAPAIIAPTATTTECMNLHLQEISTQGHPGLTSRCSAIAPAGTRQGDELEAPDNMALLPIPAYSPELNPMENVPEFLRANKIPPASEIASKQ